MSAKTMFPHGRSTMIALFAIAIAIAAAACNGSTDGDGSTGDDQNVTEGAGTSKAPAVAWKGLYGAATSHLTTAVNITSDAPLVFALSASKHDLLDTEVDAHDLHATFDDASKRSATYRDGDCTLKLTKVPDGIDLKQVGDCRTIDMPPGLTVDADLEIETERCWDSSSKTFKTPGTCKPSAGF